VGKSELATALDALGWPGAELARRLGVHVNTVSAWVTGRVRVPAYTTEYLRVVMLAHETLAGPVVGRVKRK
jgi:DNA-binding transcriptional regulator YiaG